MKDIVKIIQLVHATVLFLISYLHPPAASPLPQKKKKKKKNFESRTTRKKQKILKQSTETDPLRYLLCGSLTYNGIEF